MNLSKFSEMFDKKKTFRPKKKFQPGTMKYSLHKQAQASLNSGINLRQVVKLPKVSRRGRISADQCCGSGSVCFGPPGSASRSVSHKYGSGSFHHPAKIVRKTLISTVLWLLYDFLPVFWSCRIRVFLGLPDPHPDSLDRGTDPAIRIRTKMSRIHNTDYDMPANKRPFYIDYIFNNLNY